MCPQTAGNTRIMKTSPIHMWQFAPLLVAFCLPCPLIAQESNPHPTAETSPTAETVTHP